MRVTGTRKDKDCIITLSSTQISVAGKETRGDFLQLVGNQQGLCFREEMQVEVGGEVVGVHSGQ